MGCWLYQFLCFLLLLHLHFLDTFSSSSTQLCPPDQSHALLQFKNSFSINNSSSWYCDFAGIASYPKTESWKDSRDCCSWDGVTCNRLTGHVIGLDLSCSWLYGTIPPNSTLFLLPHLKTLNLAFNDFRNSSISSQFGSFANLTHLNLSNSMFSGQVPSQISHLSRLFSLGLSSSMFYGELRIETLTLKRIFQNLTEVRKLFLDAIDMSSVAPGSLFNLSSSLTSLSLSGCQLRGNFPINVFYLPKLQLFRLNYNSDLNGYFPKSNWSSPLELLDVSQTLFSGELPDLIGNLEFLNYLSLSHCNFTGSIPSSLKNLKQLTKLDISYNNFTGPIPDVFGNLSKLTFLDLSENNFGGQLPSSVFNLSQLESLYLSRNQLVGSIPYLVGRLPNLSYLDLSNNLLNGSIPSWVYTLPSLQVIILSNNKLTGYINEFLSRSLTKIDLASNKLDGPLPISIFEQVNLTDLSLYSNNLSGKVEIDLFSKLKNLQALDLSYNSPSFVSTNIHVNYTLPNLQFLSFSSCNITEFPYFLQASSNLKALDLSMNKIHSQTPKWMWDVGKDSLSYLNLSHNLLTGIEKLPWNNLKTLDLHSNLLQGPLPIPPLTTRFFSISNNSLSGELSSLICNVSFLEILDISHNNLGGVFPPCLGNLSESLSVLNLKKNSFHGTINAKFSKSCSLNNLNLNDNHLGGLLPRSLVNCTNLEVVDFGNNQIDDIFPYWLGSLPKLQVLVLRSNKFHGNIQNSKANHSFSKLQIFDLSNNDFEGALPTEFIKNLNSMMDVNEGKSDLQYMGDKNFSYDYSVTMTMKSIDIELVKILTIFTSIDLSNNKFEGEIPEAIGLLNWLRGLNFSHNMLTGDIPPSMGKLTNLEWLDLSSNKLVGEIPRQLADLTFLSTLNLSQNQLVGSIPQGKQFNTFGDDSYAGNLRLCGFPLSKTCKLDQPLPSTFQDEHDSEFLNGFGWKVVLMGYGCGVIFGLAIGYLVFHTGKPKWIVTLVESKQHQRAKRSKRNSHRNGGRRN